MEEKTYNEVIAKDTIIQGVAYKKGEILRQVRIRDEEAEILNKDTPVTKIEYVLEKEQPKPKGRPKAEK